MDAYTIFVGYRSSSRHEYQPQLEFGARLVRDLPAMRQALRVIGVFEAVIVLLVAIAALMPAQAGTADSILANQRARDAADKVERDTDRPGGDIRSFNMPTADLRDRPDLACKSSCKKDARCKAWTYVNPGVQGPTARCWLKSVVPPARPNKCCTSGTM